MKTLKTIPATIQPGFRSLLLVSAGLTFLLILVGIMMRASQTGLACPDWPTCYGEWMPPVGSFGFISYLHRLIALLAGLSLIASCAVAWRSYRRLSWVLRPLLLGLFFTGGQILLGRVIVIGELQPGFVALHLGLALVVLGLVILPVVIALYYAARVHDPGQEDGFDVRLNYQTPFARLSLATLMAMLLLLLSGTWVAASGANASCTGWLLCNGTLVPGDLPGWINLFHRLITASAGVLMTGLFLKAWHTQRHQTAILVTTTAAGVLFFAQVLMGAVETARNLPDYLLGLHIATAVAVWVALVVQVTLTGLAGVSLGTEAKETAVVGRRNGIILVRDFLMLTKPIVVSLLLVTTFAGMVVGAEAWPSFSLVVWTLLGGAMAAGGSGAINQYIDRFDDMKMQRTAGRPIPTGRLTPGEGLAFGVALTLASFYLMVAFVNFLAALLTLAGIIYYVLLYSIILKKTTVQNIVIGGGAGAIPPLVGWAAATGSLNVPALFLFAVVFMWTPPHFWALALVRRHDYARAGVPMLPVVRGEQETRWQIFLYTVELVALTLVLPLFGLGGGIYLVSASLLGGALLFSAWKVWRGEGNKVAWKMYRHSSMYLAFLFLALVVDALM